MWQQLLQLISTNQYKAISRAISLVENGVEGYEQLLQQLPINQIPVLGITGAPGAGKSTLTNALIGELVKAGKKTAVLCIDPSSPFNYGALLGDRIRMNEWYAHPQVFIRSLATRGSLGGLSPKIMEITDVLKASGFDYIIIETVGIGQSEVEIAGLADISMLVLVPESGDDIQFMKAGVMEIADLFVVNKCDRPGADLLVKNLGEMIHEKAAAIPIIKTIASTGEGLSDLFAAINKASSTTHEKKWELLADKAYQLIAQQRMKDISKQVLIGQLKSVDQPFNLYRFVQKYY